MVYCLTKISLRLRHTLSRQPLNVRLTSSRQLYGSKILWVQWDLWHDNFASQSMLKTWSSNFRRMTQWYTSPSDDDLAQEMSEAVKYFEPWSWVRARLYCRKFRRFLLSPCSRRNVYTRKTGSHIGLITFFWLIRRQLTESETHK
jgi:hypothetical protein